MRMLIPAVLILVVTSFAASAAPRGKDGHRQKYRSPAYATRDCTPINGFYGYYGNPWCDTGSYRPADIEFRERQRAMRRQGWNGGR
ncbi:MAG: hypothetical protein J0H36_11120 [Hyphomicrobium denitrificans]|nr:hypothetical protein [Hyphomicrobium denitrificans]